MGLCAGLRCLVLFCGGQVAGEGSEAVLGQQSSSAQPPWKGSPTALVARSERQGKDPGVPQSSAGVWLFRHALSNVVISSKLGTGLEFHGAEPCPS